MVPMSYFLIFTGIASIGLLVVATLLFSIQQLRVDNEKAAHIAKLIHNGAMTFLREEYKIIAFVVIIIAGILGFLLKNPLAALLFTSGSMLSMLTGWIGMRAATVANVRTTIAAKEKGEVAAFKVAFFGGGVMGFAVASFGLLGLGKIFYFFSHRPDFILLLTSFALGASLVAFFARIGGGIYTKSADVGADLVGKIEAGIPVTPIILS